jgi:GTP-binding protein EngB required for normal cell division
MKPLDTNPDAAAKEALNESQRLRLRVTCQYVDRLLGEIETILQTANTRSPFGKYMVDLSLPQTQLIEDYISRVRRQLLRSLAWQKMEPPTPAILASHAILTHLSFIEIAVEELRPRYMRGSGPVHETVAGELNGVVHELRSLLEGMSQLLRQDDRAGLEGRLDRLQQAGADVSLLQTIAGVIRRHGLVEFRGRLEAMTARLEDGRFEIAFFGRVSSGKSSLLNALLGAEVLPVGINPITAVPTKLQRGATSRAMLTFADGRRQEIALQELACFVTEEGNPGNTRNIMRVVAEVPSPKLREGIVLVDTPGLGSLARRGARETLAYLPSADLGVLLIDAGATLSDEDLGTLRLLYQAAIPSLILLSKADLLSPEDMHRAQSYIREHLKRQLGIAPAVHPVSARQSHAALLDQFYRMTLLPQFDRATALRGESASRKIAALREAVTGAIETMLDRNKVHGSLNTAKLEELETELRRSIGLIGEQPRVFEHDLLQLQEGCDRALNEVTHLAFRWTQATRNTVIPQLQISEWVHDFVDRQMKAPIQRLRDTSEAAIQVLQQIAGALDVADVPSQSEVAMLFRDLPRFELAHLTTSVAIWHWAIFGETVARVRIHSQLREQLRTRLQNELRAYGRVFHQWVQQTTHKLERLVNSYADGYRVQIQRLAGAAQENVDVEQLSRDLGSLLRSGNVVARQD